MKKPITVYCGYAPEDQTYVQELKKHLVSFEKRRLLTFWEKGDIAPGAVIEKEHLSHLQKADIVLLLVSPDFITEDFCSGPQMQRLVKRHAAGKVLLVPVLLRPVFWQETLFAHIQPLPGNGKPVTSSDWSTQDEAWLEVTQSIVRILQNRWGKTYRLQDEFAAPDQNAGQERNRRDASPLFDMRGQEVTSQYNAGRDLNISLNREERSCSTVHH